MNRNLSHHCKDCKVQDQRLHLTRCFLPCHNSEEGIIWLQARRGWTGFYDKSTPSIKVLVDPQRQRLRTTPLPQVPALSPRGIWLLVLQDMGFDRHIRTIATWLKFHPLYESGCGEDLSFWHDGQEKYLKQGSSLLQKSRHSPLISILCDYFLWHICWYRS